MLPLRVRVDMGVMVMKGNARFPKVMDTIRCRKKKKKDDKWGNRNQMIN